MFLTCGDHQFKADASTFAHVELFKGVYLLSFRCPICRSDKCVRMWEDDEARAAREAEESDEEGDRAAE